MAGGGAVLWALLLAVSLLATRVRELDAGATTLDLGGPEPPALVNLLTGQWRLGQEAVPATLLDLAARRLVAIEAVGPRTLVRVRADSDRAEPRASALEPYERMVFEHVVHQATNGVVPAEALTTGPEDEARGWWRRFRRSVERDGRRRGLSRPRWSPLVHTILTVASLAVAALVAVAATTLPHDPDDPDDNPLAAAAALGLITASALVVTVEALNGQRDTPAGRAVASRWLGLRAQLAEDPLFAEYPPAGVAIWDRLLAYGAAMGVAHGAVEALPLGAESEKRAWSLVGGRWRVVRVRYPRFLPPGYGRHPGVAVLMGAFQLGLAALAWWGVTAALPGVRDAAADFWSDDTVPAAFRVSVTIALAVVVAISVGLALRGGFMLAAGAADLLSPRRTVEGRVLRLRRRGSDEQVRWYVAVDDGSADRIRAWRVPPGGAVQGSTVRAAVTRWLAHVRDLQVVAPAPERPALPDEDDGDDLSPPLASLLGSVGDRTGAAADAAPLHTPLPPTTGPPPPLPDAATVSALAGRPLQFDPAAQPHPLAVDGASATFSAIDGATVQVAWVDPTFLHAHRSMPRLLRRDLPGVGDEAYRAVIGGGVVARRGGSVLLVIGRLPGMDDGVRNRAFEAIARSAVDGAAGS